MLTLRYSKRNISVLYGKLSKFYWQRAEMQGYRPLNGRNPEEVPSIFTKVCRKWFGRDNSSRDASQGCDPKYRSCVV